MYVRVFIIVIPEQCKKKFLNNCQILLKISETSVIPIVFKDILFPVRDILFLFLAIHSTLIRYQETVICILDKESKNIFAHLY